jgi:hypothetical protein
MLEVVVMMTRCAPIGRDPIIPTTALCEQIDEHNIGTLPDTLFVAAWWPWYSADTSTSSTWTRPHTVLQQLSIEAAGRRNGTIKPQRVSSSNDSFGPFMPGIFTVLSMFPSDLGCCQPPVYPGMYCTMCTASYADARRLGKRRIVDCLNTRGRRRLKPRLLNPPAAPCRRVCIVAVSVIGFIVRLTSWGMLRWS